MSPRVSVVGCVEITVSQLVTGVGRCVASLDDVQILRSFLVHSMARAAAADGHGAVLILASSGSAVTPLRKSNAPGGCAAAGSVSKF